MTNTYQSHFSIKMVFTAIALITGSIPSPSYALSLTSLTTRGFSDALRLDGSTINILTLEQDVALGQCPHDPKISQDELRRTQADATEELVNIIMLELELNQKKAELIREEDYLETADKHSREVGSLLLDAEYRGDKKEIIRLRNLKADADKVLDAAINRCNQVDEEVKKLERLLEKSRKVLQLLRDKIKLIEKCLLKDGPVTQEPIPSPPPRPSPIPVL